MEEVLKRLRFKLVYYAERDWHRAERLLGAGTDSSARVWRRTPKPRPGGFRSVITQSGHHLEVMKPLKARQLAREIIKTEGFRVEEYLEIELSKFRMPGRDQYP
jgi:hypothetical protein